jgi:hypothetical protein
MAVEPARSQPGPLKFDERIRREAADHTATRPCTAQILRNAVDWREVLGPRVSLAPESGSDSSSSPG